MHPVADPRPPVAAHRQGEATGSAGNRILDTGPGLDYYVGVRRALDPPTDEDTTMYAEMTANGRLVLRKWDGEYASDYSVADARHVAVLLSSSASLEAVEDPCNPGDHTFEPGDRPERLQCQVCGQVVAVDPSE